MPGSSALLCLLVLRCFDVFFCGCGGSAIFDKCMKTTLFVNGANKSGCSRLYTYSYRTLQELLEGRGRRRRRRARARSRSLSGGQWKRRLDISEPASPDAADSRSRSLSHQIMVKLSIAGNPYRRRQHSGLISRSPSNTTLCVRECSTPLEKQTQRQLHISVRLPQCRLGRLPREAHVGNLLN